jgi:hypothetical protein
MGYLGIQFHLSIDSVAVYFGQEVPLGFEGYQFCLGVVKKASHFAVLSCSNSSENRSWRKW